MEWEAPNPLDALFLQKQYHYRGRAKISLHHLEFEDENVAGGRTVTQEYCPTRRSVRERRLSPLRSREPHSSLD